MVEMRIGELSHTALCDFGAVLRGQARERGEGEEAHLAWEASARRALERSRAELRQQWHEFHLEQAERLERTAEALAAEHRARAEALLEEGGA